MASLFGGKKRKVVNPIREQDPNSIIKDHLVKNTGNNNTLVQEYDVVSRERPTPFCMRDLKIPHWLLSLLVSLAVVLFTAFAVFAAVVTLKKETNGGACKSNSDCRQDFGLMCNNYRCGCAYSHFWSDSYQLCERRRMINRTCANDTMCDALGSLICKNTTLSGGTIELQCQCQSAMSWNGIACAFQGLYNASCILDTNCDDTRFLYCNLLVGGLCRCNTSMFWNGNSVSGTCEYKRTVNQYCYPYDSSWCDNTGPVGQGLVCTAYANPYGSEYGVCQCSTNWYYNGSASLGNGFCVPMHSYNQTCTSVSNCDYRGNFSCLNNLCLCASSMNYNPLITNAGFSGVCVPAYTYLQNCTSTSQCSASQSLYCELSFYGGSNVTGVCLCNTSWSYWDGVTCASKLSIGGQCSSNTNCISSQGLFCSNYTQSLSTCDCDKSYFWNGSCLLKYWYNISCSSNYVCDDNRGLQCQGTGGSLFGKCDCYNSSYMWDSLYVNNQSQTCILKKTNGVGVCYGDLECQDYNYLVCNNVTHTCACIYTDYWDTSSGRCQAKRNFSDPCNYTAQCRDFSDVFLICQYTLTYSPAGLYCICNSSSYWEVCVQKCVVTKSYLQMCSLSGNCTSNECDLRANLQCLNETRTGISTSGWCNCTSLQWWNGTYCRNKGTPSWGSNSSAICNATYQCADYNLVSCPLGGSFTNANPSTCECATTKYWNGVTCLDRVLIGASCTVWPALPVNTSTCLSAAGAGLSCIGATCLGNGTCLNGTCTCPSGTTWNSTFSICAVPSSG